MNQRLLKFLKFAYGSHEVIGKDGFFADFKAGFLRKKKGFVQEIAGRDSVAAFKRFLDRNNAYDYVVLSVAFSPVEFGDLRHPLKAIEIARSLAAQKGIEVLISVSKSAYLWKELVSENLIENSNKYGFFSPCIGCHLYLHILRGFLATITGAEIVVSGERLYHGDKIKVNQALPCITAYAQVLKSIGVDLVFPVMDLKEEKSILELLPEKWAEGKGQMECLFSGTSKLTADRYDELRTSIERYLSEHLIPSGTEILKRFVKIHCSI